MDGGVSQREIAFKIINMIIQNKNFLYLINVLHGQHIMNNDTSESKKTCQFVTGRFFVYGSLSIILSPAENNG